MCFSESYRDCYRFFYIIFNCIHEISDFSLKRPISKYYTIYEHHWVIVGWNNNRFRFKNCISCHRRRSILSTLSHYKNFYYVLAWMKQVVNHFSWQISKCLMSMLYCCNYFENVLNDNYYCINLTNG